MKRIKKLNIFDEQRNLVTVEEMSQADLSTMIQQMARLQIMLQNIQEENRTLKERLDRIPTNPGMAPPATVRLQPVNVSYTTPEEINLDVFKALPVFDGNIARYRIWREDVSRLMEGIRIHQNSNRYVEALSIIKTKIQGPAADVLTNHNTIFNFDAIRNRLDYTYADQRPLYVLQDEMKKLTQGRRNLSEFHDEINKALTLITSKISMSGHSQEVIDVMTNEATQEAVRVFKDGISNSYIRSTLYGNPIKDLEHAFAVARTIEHDDEHRKLRLSYSSNEQRNYVQPIQRLNDNHHHHHRRPSYIHQQRQVSTQHQHQPRPEPMDTSSGNTNQYRRTNNQQHHPWKRHREPSTQFHQSKFLRSNNLKVVADNQSMIVETGTINKIITKTLN